MDKITIKQLEWLRDVIARELGRPQFHCVGGAWQLGALLIEQGSRTNGITWKLAEITTPCGGENDILRAWSARELFDLMHAYLRGIQDARRTP